MGKKDNSITAVIIQARMKSSRFYGKILKKINNKALLDILISRLKKLKEVDKIIVATSKSVVDKKIVKLCKKNNYDYFIGSENDVQSRYYGAAKKFNVSNIIRITSDCPLIDINIIKKIRKLYHSKKKKKYVSNVIFPTYPDGMDVEMFPFELLEQRIRKKISKFEKEHVTPFFINQKKKENNLFYSNNYSKLRLTIDTKDDYLIIRKISKHLDNDIFVTLKDIVSLYKRNPGFFEKNQNVKRR